MRGSVMTINLRRMGAIIAFIQFTNALEYMIFNPLFVYMAPTFQVPVSWAGYVSGIYTLASVIFESARGARWES